MRSIHAAVLGLVVVGAVTPATRADLLYVSQGNTRIVNYDTTANPPTPMTFATGLNSPSGLAFDASGNLYTANYYANTIERFTPDGVASTFASTGLRNPTALVFDASGNLYAANNGNNTIERFTPDGVGSVFATTSGAPLSLAILPSAAVPEPRSVVLMEIGALMGLGYIGPKLRTKVAA